MKTPTSEIRQLLVLTTFLTQKTLVASGKVVFLREKIDNAEIDQRADQVIRLRGELDRMVNDRIHEASLTLSEEDDLRSLLLFRNLGSALEEISTQAMHAARLSLSSPERKPGSKASRQLFHAWSQGGDLLTTALAVLMEAAPLDSAKVVRKLSEERFRMTSPLRQSLPTDDSLIAAILNVLKGFDGAISLISSRFDSAPSHDARLRN